MTADDRPLHELSHAELVDRCQRLANAFVANQKRIQADLEPILRTAMADAWDEGAHAAWERSTPEVNGARYRWRHEGEPRNPYREET